MNDEREFDQWLQREMVRHTDYLDDDGFTDRVMGLLPAKPQRRGVYRTVLGTVLLAVLAGSLGLVLFAGSEGGYALALLFIDLPLLTLMQLGAGVSLALGVVGAIALWSEALWR